MGRGKSFFEGHFGKFNGGRGHRCKIGLAFIASRQKAQRHSEFLARLAKKLQIPTSP